MADNLQINIGGNADGAIQAADEMGRSFATNAGEIHKHLANLNQALSDFQQRSGKNFTRFSLNDLDDQSLQAYGAAVASCQANIMDLQDALRGLGTRTEANGEEFDTLTAKLLAAENIYRRLQSQLVNFKDNAGEMQKNLDNLNQALSDFSKNSDKKVTPFSLKDLDDKEVRALAIAITDCQNKIIDLQNALRGLGTRTNANGQEFDKLTNELREAQSAYSELQSQLATYRGKAGEATEASDKLGKSTEKTGNFLRQIGVTTMLYGMARITNEFEKAAEAAVKFKEAAEGLENIKAPSGVEGLANNLESISRATDALQGAAAGAAAGAPFGPWGSVIGAVAGGTTNAIVGERNREMQAATNSATQLRNVSDQIKNEKEQERFDLAKANFQTTFDNQLQYAQTPQERLEALDLAIGQFGNYSPEEIQKRIGYNQGKVDELNNKITSTTWDMGNDLDRHKLNILVKQRDKFQQSIEQDDAFLENVKKAITAAEKEIAKKNKADIKAEEEAAKEAEKARKAKEKAEKEAAKKELKAKKDALNEEYKDLKDEKAKEQQLLRDTEKEMSDNVSQRNDKISDITSTRDSISTSFSKVGGSVGPQFAALSKVLENEQASLKNYQDTMKKNIQTITSVIKDIDNEMKANREKLAALG